MSEQRPSQTVEDYLQLIYTMQRDEGPVIAARLKERMGVTAPTVLSTLRRMERDALVSVDGRHQIGLTAAGIEAAESIIRRHMLAERLLTDILKLDWAEAHDEAHRMEHAISPLVERQLRQLLGDPTTCPHGNRIPGLAKEPPPRTWPLRDCRQGEAVVVNNISEHAEEDKELMRFLQRSGLTPGARVTVTELLQPNETITVCVEGGGGAVVVGLGAAQVVQVRSKAEE
jgi:DtxR family Mn-dependent transcriptional regulator